VRKWSAMVLVATILVVVDQTSKWLVETRMPFQELVNVVPFLGIFRTYNTGVAFSFMSGSGPWVLAVLSIAICAFVLWLYASLEPDRALTATGYMLVIGGALGNLIDRISLGYVVDFILFHTQSWSFAVFNLADSFITIGACAIIVDEFFHWRAARSGDPHNG